METQRDGPNGRPDPSEAPGPSNQEQNRRRYSRIVPFSKLPGPVVISSHMTNKRDEIIRALQEIVEKGSSRLTPAQVHMIGLRARLLQTDIFNDLERRNGPRTQRNSDETVWDNPVTMGFRYNLKAFVGPIMDLCNELWVHFPSMPFGIRRAKSKILWDLLNRVLHMDHDSLY